MYQRFSKKRIVQLLKDFRIVYLTGPRQSGKSTLAMSIAHETGLAYYTLDDAALLLAARTDPQGLLAALSTPMVLGRLCRGENAQRCDFLFRSEPFACPGGRTHIPCRSAPLSWCKDRLIQ